MGSRPEFTRIRAQLQKSLHFRELQPEDLDRLAEVGRLRRLRDSELASAAGQPLNQMWLVLQGGLRLSTVTEPGEEFVYAMLGPGSFYGLGHVVGAPNTIADARAFGPTELAVFDGAPLLAMFDRYPRLWHHVAGLMVRRLSLAMSVIRDMSVASLEQRLVRRLLGQAMSGGVDIDGAQPVELRVNQSDLSRMLGSSRSRVNAELKRLEGQGMLKVGYRAVKLIDLPRMREIAGPEVFAF